MIFFIIFAKIKIINMNDSLVRKGKYLALLLRHQPEKANLIMLDNGWVLVKELLKNTDFTMTELEEIVKTDNKGRYSFNADKSKIKANQGHTTDVDIKFERKIPPKNLYHGTAYKFINSIMKWGITKQKRHHVHLSDNEDTALTVGKRHGNPVVLIIDAESMTNDGYDFFISDNGVWLTDIVPTKYISM